MSNSVFKSFANLRLLPVFLVVLVTACGISTLAHSAEEVANAAVNTVLAVPPVNVEAQEEEAKVLATVNGETITELQVQGYQAVLQQQLKTQLIDRDIVLDQMITLTLLSQLAREKNLDNSPEVRQALDLQQKILYSTIMQQTLLEEDLQPKEDQLEDLYEKLPGFEFRVNYILVEDESLAYEIIQKLGSGVSFDSLAKTYSLDPTGQHGGNLGWVSPLQVSPAITQSVYKVRPGTFSKKPTKGPGGWQIFETLERRVFQKPPFFQARNQMLDLYLKDRLVEYMESLKKKASIVKNP